MEVPSIVDLMNDESTFGPFFRGKSWDPWKAFLCLLFGLPTTAEQDAIIVEATRRSQFPADGFREIWLSIGRRGGKTLMSAFIAIYVSFFRDFREYLAPGEQPITMICAADTRQAKILLKYIKGFVRAIPVLQSMVVRDTLDGLELANGTALEVHPASLRARGYTACLIVNDELSYWQSDENSAEPDREILQSQRPCLASIPQSMMLNISSPYGRFGELYRAYQEHFGRDDSRALFWKAASRAPNNEEVLQMNCSIPLEVVRQAYESDAASAASEYGGEFRSDLEKLFTTEQLDACTDYDRPLILPPDFADETDEVTL